MNKICFLSVSKYTWLFLSFLKIKSLVKSQNLDDFVNTELTSTCIVLEMFVFNLILKYI